MKKISISASMPMHSYQTAKGLAQKGLLGKYYTTVYNNNNLLYKLMELVLPRHLSRRVTGKRIDGIDEYIKKYCEFEGLLFLSTTYIPIIKNKAQEIKDYINNKFNGKVINDIIKDNPDAVIAYDLFAEELFNGLKKRDENIMKILDMSSVSIDYQLKVINEEIAKGYPLSSSMVIKKNEYPVYIVDKCRNEMKCADLIIAASKFSAHTIKESSIPEDRIKLIHLGVDINRFQFTKRVNKDGVLNFLFVGRVEAPKGIHYLLEAFSDARITSRNIHLTIVGDYSSISDKLKFNNPMIEYLGMKTFAEMPKIFASSDIYIMTSLWEGFSLSLLEAMASGMPSIATSCSIAPEVITNYKNGIVIPPANIDAIINAIIWFDENRQMLSEMSRDARKVIEDSYTWEHYYQELHDFVASM